MQDDAKGAGAGAMAVFGSQGASGKVVEDRILLETTGREPMTLQAKLVVKWSSLHAQGLAHAIENFPAEHIPPLHYAKVN